MFWRKNAVWWSINNGVSLENLVEEILRAYWTFLVDMVYPSSQRNVPLIYDNTHLHSAHMVNAYIWNDVSARSSDQNPKEHTWDELGTCVSKRKLTPATLDEVKEALV